VRFVWFVNFAKFRRKCSRSSVKVLPLIGLLLLLTPSIRAQSQLTRYVDPFIGTAGHGHTFPGATLPFGMVQLSPDTRLTGWDGCSGYHFSDRIIYGFSHTHLSGTGISDYGDILLMPTVGEIVLNSGGSQNNPGYASSFNHSNETAQPGYYSVRLDNNIRVELTATARAGFHRYSFSPQTSHGNVIVDLTHRDRVLDSYLRVVNGTQIEGFRRSEAWARDQVVYFVAEVSQPFDSFGVSVDNKVSTGVEEGRGENVKAFLRFSTQRQILVKVGISAVSIDGARKNLAAEIPDWDFDRVKMEADRAWNAMLNKIQITGGGAPELKTFYTALYHTMLAPNLFMDVDHQYRGRDFKIHTATAFDNYTVFSLWDTFRAAHPLYTIIDQKRTVDFIKTFLAQYEQGGRLPVWELAANETDTMIGYHAVSVLADAFAKGIRDFDLELAFAAMKHSAELTHFGLNSYKQHGFIEMEQERESVSKTLEYAYDDWCIAETARLLNRPGDYARYSRRAQFYKNLFDRESGFMRPRSNGGWLRPFDPREVDFNFTEANSWQYTFFAPQDISGLIELMGGQERFARKLDQLFNAESKTTGREQADITGMIGQYAHGNEPSHHMAYLFNYASQPWKTQHRVREIMNDFYKAEPNGLIGNEDCGQMSAWYVLSAAGFYPVTPGTPLYAIGSPLFPEVRLNLENGKSFVIKTKRASETDFYIKSARLNGREYRKSFIMHQDLMAGGELVFELRDRPNRRWGSGPSEIPVSRISSAKIVPAPVIKAAARTFSQRLKIDFGTLDTNLRVYYTTDGSKPDARAQRFRFPFSIDNTTTVKAVAMNGRGESSSVVTAVYRKVLHNWNVVLDAKYSRQYAGGGELGLIDGLRGTTNFSGGAWQGYQGQDLVAIIDLGRTRSVSRLGAGFLQEIRSWIWMPRRIEFALSTHGRDFTQVLSISNDVSEREYGTVIKDFMGSIPPQHARYIRIKALNYGKIPTWHPGSGGDAWIFVDEIIIE
jgi:predicted alpha-1,2-mannosidase